MGFFSSDMLEETEEDVFKSRELSVNYFDIFIWYSLFSLTPKACVCLGGRRACQFFSELLTLVSQVEFSGCDAWVNWSFKMQPLSVGLFVHGISREQIFLSWN